MKSSLLTVHRLGKMYTVPSVGKGRGRVLCVCGGGGGLFRSCGLSLVFPYFMSEKWLSKNKNKNKNITYR